MTAPAKNPRESLRVTQEGTHLNIAGRYASPDYAPLSIVLVDRDTNRDIAGIRMHTDGPTFEASIDLSTWVIDSESTIDLYFEGDHRTVGRHRVRVGRFTETRPVIVENVHGIGAYYTVKGNLSLSDERIRPLPMTFSTRSLSLSDGVLSLSGTLSTVGAPLKSASIVLEARGALVSYRVPARYEPRTDSASEYGLHSYDVHASVGLHEVVNVLGVFTTDVLDPVIEMETEWDTQSPPRVRISAPQYRQRRRIRPFVVSRGSAVAVFIPYFTVKASRLAVRVESFDAGTYRYMRTAAMLAPLHRVRGWFRGTWLIGELPYKAQDNGMRLFRYIRDAYPERRTHYVIDPESEDAERISELGNVVAFRSKEHIRLSLEATRLIGTHHLQYVLPTWLPWFDRRARGIRVFLQHGIAGPKNMTGLYGARAGLDPDYFVVSSEFERELVINDYGYRPNQVRVTGFPRFDTLLEPSGPPKRQIVVMPTWRDWLFTRDDVLGSQFYAEWSAFLSSRALHAALDQHDVALILMLHPNMRPFLDLFRFQGIMPVEHGQTDIQQLLKDSALLVTDYSSVGFDFAFLHRPVFYFMFDRDEFNSEPSHMDAFSDLPGRVVTDANALVAGVVDSISEGCAPDAQHAQRADRLLKYRDTDASERVYQLTRHARRRFHFWNRLATSDLGRTVADKYRRSKYFDSSMRVLYGIARVLPLKKTVLFESGLGKQYGGNPKYLYEELADRGESKNTVWVLNTTQRMKDPTTRKYARNTPRFYWHLGRAKAWITDQHFPHGLRPSRSTSFIQTWHGTPLKRMWFDQDQIKFQPDDYVKKGSKRLAYWDVLLAQSEWAAGIFRSAFRFTDRMVVEGYPRNDILARNDAHRASEIRHRLGVPEGKRVVLYAPTFRDDERKRVGWAHEMALDIERFGRELGDDWFLLVRTHIFVRGDRRLERRLDGTGADVSAYDDVQELLLVADVLITDYSSVMFDFAVTGRPMVFFAYDLRHYRDDLRGFYLDYEQKMPGPVVSTSDEAIDAVRGVDAWGSDYHEARDRFREEFSPYDDGLASERVIDRLEAEGLL